jgi:hypothetical protein
MSKEKVYGPFFFAESTVTGTSYLDMMQEWPMPQLDDDSDDFIYQKNGAPAPWSAATSVSICHNIGSDARQPMTTRCFAGHPDHLI